MSVLKFSQNETLSLDQIRSPVERERDHFMKSAAKWQMEYLKMKKERDNLIELLKFHHVPKTKTKISDWLNS